MGDLKDVVMRPLVRATLRDHGRRTDVTDRQRLETAFEEFRARKFWARQAQADGWDAVPEDAIRRGKGVVFWHRNEGNVFADDGMLARPLHIKHFVVDTQEVRGVLKSCGLATEIDSGPIGGVNVLPQ